MSFDKFIKDIVKRESLHRKNLKDHAEGQEELPQRRYNDRYREKWQNSVIFRRKKSEHGKN